MNPKHPVSVAQACGPVLHGQPPTMSAPARYTITFVSEKGLTFTQM